MTSSIDSARPSTGTRASICGYGAVTGYGWGSKLLTEGMLSGKSAVRPTAGFSPCFDEDVQWVARIEDGGDPADGQSRFARAVRFAAREAVHNAIDRGWRPGPTVGVIHGIVLGDVEMWADYHHARGVGISKRSWLSLMPSAVLTAINREFGFHGPTMAVTAMCASGLAGLLTAKMWIDSGMVSDVLMLTSDLSGSPENARAFVRVGVLVTDGPSLENCRPFQEGSRGFSGGEAAVGFIVSNSPAGSYATLRGGAMSHDGFHIISLNPDRVDVTKAFVAALENSGVAPEEIAYMNAHGPGTRQCDAVEAAIFDELFPTAEGIFSVKPLTGHCQAATGGVEVIATLAGFSTGVIPAPPRVAKGHPRLLDGPTPCASAPVVKSSLGMGGHNAVMILEPPARS